MSADDATAQHDHLCRSNTRHAAKKDAAPTVRLLQCPRADLRGKAARDLGHRGQQGQAAARIGDGFIGNRRDAGFQQVCGLFRIRGEVEVGEEQLPFAQAGAFDGLGFLDLDDHVRGGKHLIRGADDLGPCGGVVGIGKARAGACVGFDDHAVAMRHGLMHRAGSHPDAELLRFDFFRATDFHVFSP